MGFSTSTCTEFVEVLASKAPVPGGGGASALVGAVGTALGNMVGSLTVGKKEICRCRRRDVGAESKMRPASERFSASDRKRCRSF